MIRVGVVGYGYWGPNLARNFSEIPGSIVTAIADLSADRRSRAAARHPGAAILEDAAQLIGRNDVDAVVVATPISSHHTLAMLALEAGKHVLVEKPISSTASEALELIREAERRHLTLMVDHTFLYTGAVRKIIECVHAGALGDIQYYDAVRVNLGLIQTDVNVLWDLAVHDLSIIDAVMPQRPVAVSAVAMGHVPGHPENIAYLTLFFPSDQIAHLHVNWLAPVKIRRTLIGCRTKMIVYDDLEPSEKVKIYDCGADVNDDPESRYRLLVSYRQGDMWAPRLDTTEGLRAEAIHFVECIATGAVPLTSGLAGLRVVRILEAAERSSRECGRRIELHELDRLGE